jgi:iron complex transport system substrate-binding protein
VTIATDAEASTSDGNDRAAELSAQLEAARTVELALAPLGEDGERRTIVSDGVELDIPADPLRIVTLEPSLTDAVAALGLADRIVGTVEDPSTGGFHEHIADYLGPDVINVGAEGGSNLEQVLTADPDLILTWDWYIDQVPDLREIAPTVVVPYDHYDAEVGETLSNEQYVTWVVREVAALLGVDDRVDGVMDDFRAAVEEGRAALEAAVGDESVALLDVRIDEILLSGYGFDGISALFYGDLGLEPDPLSAELPVWEALSLERVPDLTAQHIVTFADGDEAQTRLDELLGTAVWQRVPAVASGSVVVVPPGLYYRGDDGPLGTAKVIDDLVARLTS